MIKLKNERTTYVYLRKRVLQCPAEQRWKPNHRRTIFNVTVVTVIALMISEIASGISTTITSTAYRRKNMW
jgi:hypothetical protein